MAQQQIRGDTGTVDGDGSFTTYTVPGNTIVTPYSVSVTADGTSASGAFLPCLTFKTITGAIIARCPAPEVAAGDTAEVSWFPHVAAAAASAGALDPSWGTYFMNSQLVGSGGHVAGKWNFNAGSALLTIDGFGVAKTVSRGVYQITAWIQSDDAWTAGAVAGGRIDVGNPTGYVQRQTGGVTPAGSMKNFAVTLTAQINAGQEVDIEFENFDTAGRNMYSNQILVQLIGTF